MYCEFSNRPNDYAALDSLQRKLDLRPLSAYGNPGYVNPPGVHDPQYDYDPFVKNEKLSLVAFFDIYNQLSAYNPPEKPHKSLAESFEKYNIGANEKFTLSVFDTEVAEKLNKIP